ncbi:MAG: HD domain-containing protein [Spirochaetes bacterium]|nr:HD domain-containing protein [Spirochaetota bacterium]
MHIVCPGARLLRQPKPETFDCPFCGEEVEIWTDEIKAVCPKCKKTVFKDQNQSCLEWCKLAKECVGESAYNTYMENRNMTIKESLLKELANTFGDDVKRINHAKKVLKYAEQLLAEENGDWHIVVPAAILHDIGIKAAEEKYGSPAGKYQEKEGPPIAKKMLFKLGLKLEVIEEICEIIAHHHSPGIIDTDNFKILYDADWLVNIKDEVKTDDKSKLERIINKVFLTDTGRKTAEKIYL